MTPTIILLLLSVGLTTISAFSLYHNDIRNNKKKIALSIIATVFFLVCTVALANQIGKEKDKHLQPHTDTVNK